MRGTASGTLASPAGGFDGAPSPPRRGPEAQPPSTSATISTAEAEARRRDGRGILRAVMRAPRARLAGLYLRGGARPRTATCDLRLATCDLRRAVPDSAAQRNDDANSDDRSLALVTNGARRNHRQ